MKSLLVHNFVDRSEKSSYYTDFQIFYVFEFKYDLSLHGKDYCVQKYGDEIYYIHTISNFVSVDIINIHCSNTYTNDKNTSNLINVDDDYETDDIYKLFNMIVYKSRKSIHKVLSKSSECNKYYEFANTDNYDVIHVIDIFELHELMDLIDFNHGSRKDVFYRYKIYLYNYNKSFSSLLRDIFDNEIDEEILREFNIRYMSPSISI